jgi:site-specific recombinase XerD
VSERRTPLSRKTAWAAIRNCGKLAGLPLPIHPHMLRHACGYALADQGADTRLIQDYLGHRNIQHTVIYTAANPAILVSAKKLRFLIEPCFSVGAASSREWLTVAAGSRSYKNESFDA